MQHKCFRFVYDRQTQRVRKCKGKRLIYSCCCVTHSRKHAILIQTHWRSFVIRRKLAVFTLLPPELWNVILFYVRFEYNIKHKLFKTYYNIYLNRKNSFILPDGQFYGSMPLYYKNEDKLSDLRYLIHL
jgi:hypothetical protein